ncbi:integrase, catalytic region, zinc finger, CCHC-type containing protein [Tanacetum coccineum]|uniref:Integrase, catalytic region, zinc finger, CCHC-type containing protein n=1 Tax=Tanacetum coccineum TaxID=301880 RepID=A0ABQ5IHU6_9ASTR
MRGTIQNKVDRETRFTNEFDQFVVEPGEALVSVYNRFAQLMNDLERNNMNFPTVTINKKFLNTLQPEWLKYVTQVRLAKQLTVDSFDDLFDYLQQFEKLVNASRAKKNADELMFQEEVVESNDAQKRTGNVQRTLRIPSSGNTSTVQCYNCSKKGHYARNCPKPRVHDSKYFMEQMLLAKQDEAGVILTDDQNDFLFADASKIQINDFCQDQVKPILNELKVYLEFFRNLFQRDIKEMKDVFESTESELDELEKQNDLLKDQLLEASLKHDVELCVLLNHECVDKILSDELDQVKKKSFEIQEGLQSRIKILEKDVQRCQKQSVDFELKLQHEKEKHKWDSTSRNKNTNPSDYSWIIQVGRN